MPIVVIHYHEIGLKGKNRRFFEDALRKNIDNALAGLPHRPTRRLQGRLEVALDDGVGVDAVRQRLNTVFGLTGYSFAHETESSISALKEAAWQLLRDEPFQSFFIRTKRSWKQFPMTSVEIDAAVGEHVLEQREAKVDLKRPDITCHIELLPEKSFVYARKHSGPGGLPVGVSGRVVCLMSGGIDSPVAAYRIMRRGARVMFVHFHGEPFTDRSSQSVARELVQLLTRHQFRSTLYMVPFGGIQREVSLTCDPSYRILLYRRLMMRIAEGIASKERALALATGESLGQVASQTLQNLRSIDDAARLPVLRPLIAYDKQEIIELAQRIGTFDVSTTPYVEDCCPLFMPDQPATRSKLHAVREQEALLPVDSLVMQGLTTATVEKFTFLGGGESTCVRSGARQAMRE